MHQPVDNFKWVIDLAVEVCYAPFFEVMSRYPEFKFSLHCSGWLMEQIESDYPSLYQNIQELIAGGSIELFSAGYYEPILSSIPSDDATSQIELLNQSISKQFDQTPQGAWLTERVWESSLIPTLSGAGIKYTLVDDYHFESAGFERDRLDGYYMSEGGGERIGLFPISQKLRYALPFLSVKSAIEAIKSFDREENSTAIIFDDAEKFGMWPKTYEWVYKKGWLEEFVSSIIADKQIESMHYRDYFYANRPRGIAYLPDTSYYEMGEWSLKADDAKGLNSLKARVGDVDSTKFIRGGIWKNFFIKYEESNRIHKRMLELSKARDEVDSPKFDTLLYKLQTNDSLWHGVFGGLYLPNLRDNAYRFLIDAERVRYRERKSHIEMDSNSIDGYPKFKAVTPKYLFRFDSSVGGQLVEFDIFKSGFNWQNSLTRREELYHQDILNPKPMVEENREVDGIDTIHNATQKIDDSMRDALIYDWYLKNSFIDHITDSSFGLESFRRCSFKELGDFANQPFESSFSQKEIRFGREGGVYTPQKHNSTLNKSYFIRDNGFKFGIDFTTTLKGELKYLLELNLHFNDYESLLINGEIFDGAKEIEAIKKLSIVDPYTKKEITISLNTPFDLYYYLVDTISQSEDGFELTTQAISFGIVVAFEEILRVDGKLKVK
jgi:hypothetical protein